MQNGSQRALSVAAATLLAQKIRPTSWLALRKRRIFTRTGPDGEGSPIRLFSSRAEAGSPFPWLCTILPKTRSAVRVDTGDIARFAPKSKIALFIKK
jgi:hypothetical protein